MRLNVVHVLNYSVRVGIIVLGLFFLSGKVASVPGDPSFTKWVGGAFVAFGLYRSVLYYIRSRQEAGEDDDDQEFSATEEESAQRSPHES